MTNTNQELLQKAHDQEVEGQEWETLTTQVGEYIAQKTSEFNTTIAEAQARIAELTDAEMPADVRSEISTALGNAKTKFDDQQRVLLALITPSADPVPEPEPLPVESARRRRR